MQYFVDAPIIGAVSVIDEMKRRIGARVKALRAGRKQATIASMAGVGRDIVSDIENASTDYRIDSLLQVLVALKTDGAVLQEDDSIEEILKGKLVQILRKGDPVDRNYIMSVIERTAATMERLPAARSGPKRSGAG